MYNNWFVDERVLQSRHAEMLKTSELIRQINEGVTEKHPPFHVRTLSKLGDNLVKAGFWLQDRYSERLNFRNFEIDDTCL